MKKIRTAAQVRANAVHLDGARSRVALAATENPVDPPETPAGTTGELWLYGLVGGYWHGFNAASVAEALRDLDVDYLTVRVHSPGGDAADGVAIANLLRNHRAHVTIVVDGLAASAASVIATAGDTVVMCPGSQMMLHDASTYGYGNAAELRRVSDWIDGQSANYATVYAHRAGGTAQQWREVMLANDGWGTWYTAEAAVTAGLATEVGTRTAVGSPPTAPADQWDDDSWAKAVHDLDVLEHFIHPAAAAAWRGERPKPPTASAEGSTETEGGSAVSFTDKQMTELRSNLGLADDADEAAIVAAVADLVEQITEPDSDSTARATAQIPAGHVVIPQVRLDDLTAGANSGREAAAKLHEMEREAFLDAHATKFPATSRAKWAAEYDKNPTATATLLGEAGDLVPVGEVGHAETETVQANVTESPTYKNWRI